MQHITVLMSAYNGERFIREQVESILNQTGVNVRLIVRDDGSSDDTVKLLEEFGSRDIEITRGENLGVFRSFEWLVLDAPEDDWYAFADQDDIWDSGKLSTAVSFLSGIRQPALYFCNQTCFSEDNGTESLRLPRENLQPSFVSTLFRNHYAGCTMVFNRALMEKLQQVYRASGDSFAYIHDSLTMMIAQLVGVTVYDPQSRMKYRRHAGTYSEAALYRSLKLQKKFQFLSRIARKFFRMDFYRNRKGSLRYLCKTLEESLGDELNPEDLEALRYIRSYADSVGNWLGFLLHNRFRRYFPQPVLPVYLKIFLRIY